MRHITRYRLILSSAFLLTCFLVWFAFSGYLSATPVAQAMQQGQAFLFGQTIEALVSRDTSFSTLKLFAPRDVAYFALIDRHGTIRYHSNSDLIGEVVSDDRYRSVFSDGVFSEQRVRLGTGEDVYESHLPLHLPHEVLALRLALHSWQSDEIIRRAKAQMVLTLVLVVAAWLLGGWALRLQRREYVRQQEMSRREHLVRLGELGAIVAHEVRTPLAGIKGYAQLVQERAEDPRTAQYTTAIVQESLRLERLVNDLLSYARQEADSSHTAVVGKVLAAAWNLLAEEARRHNVQLTVEGHQELAVYCSEGSLQQVLLNILANAVYATPDDGAVHVVIESQGSQVRIQVIDQGPGFTPEALERCFDPFYSTRSSGSGLGLAICKKIVDSCQGNIRVTNLPIGGAVVDLRLPSASGVQSR